MATAGRGCAQRRTPPGGGARGTLAPPPHHRGEGAGAGSARAPARPGAPRPRAAPGPGGGRPRARAVCAAVDVTTSASAASPPPAPKVRDGQDRASPEADAEEKTTQQLLLHFAAADTYDPEDPETQLPPNVPEEVGVVCNNIPGTFRVRDGSVRCNCVDCRGNVRYTAGRWEAHCGRGTSRKWRQTIRVSNIAPPVAIGEWLDSHGVQAARAGRPMGHEAWNKGMKLAPSHRDAIASKLREKWQDADYRQSVIEAMQDNVPWNKGATLSAETRTKMSTAKVGRQLSAAHRQAVAAAHRRRANARRVFKDVQATLVRKSLDTYDEDELSDEVRAAAAHVLDSSASPESAPPLAASPSPLGEILEPSEAAVETATRALRKGKWNKKDRAIVSREVRLVLREYREIREELKPWTAQFEIRYGRKPTMTDVKHTKMPWLEEKFHRYVTLRTQLFQHSARGELSEEGSGRLNANRSAKAAQAPTSRPEADVKKSPLACGLSDGPSAVAALRALDRALEYQEAKQRSGAKAEEASLPSPPPAAAPERVHTAFDRARRYRKAYEERQASMEDQCL